MTCQNIKLVRKINLKANQWSKNASQNVSQLSLHRFGRKCALTFDSKSVSKLVYESLVSFCQVNNASESVCKNIFGLNCISNTNYGKM